MWKYFGVLIFVVANFCVTGHESKYNISTSEIMDEILTWFMTHDTLGNRTAWQRFQESSHCSSLEEIHFLLYPNRTWEPDVLDPNDPATLENARWKKGAPVKILVHGFQNSADTMMPQIVKNAYLRHELYSGEEANVIVVDWGCYAMNAAYHLLPIWYRTALQGVEKTGVKIGNLMNQLLSMNNGVVTSPSAFHIIGHSLGAHVAGHAGNTFQKLTKKSIGRITGLDPAGPGFTELSWYNPKRWYFGGQYRCLMKSDATLVDVIHTAWGSLGIDNDLGDHDFFPNDDVSSLEKQMMPGCKSSGIFSGMWEGISAWSCSHRKAPIYFAVSIIQSLGNKLVACGCKAPNYQFNPEIVQKCKSDCKFPCNFGEYYDGNCKTRTNFVTVPQGKVSFEDPSSVAKFEL